MKASVIVVEDNLLLAEDVIETLEKFDYEVLESFTTGEEARDWLTDHYESVDFALLDIELAGKMTGIDLANHINKKFKKRKIGLIFLTAFQDDLHFRQAKRSKPAAYLFKNQIGDKDLNIAIELALANANDVQPEEQTDGYFMNDRIFVRQDTNKFVRMAISDIDIIEADGSYTRIIANRRKYMLSESLKKVESKMAGLKQFVRIHKSYIVNVNKIDGFENSFIEIGEDNYPIGKTYLKGFLAKFRFV